jgi:hypothetical protein
MGLAKSIKALLSIAASGGFALILSGTAYAAESAPAETAQPTAKTAATEVNKTTPTDKPETVNMTVQTANASTGTTPQAAAATDKPQTPASPAPGIGNSPAQPDAAKAPVTTANPAGAEPLAAKPAEQPAPVVAAPVLPATPEAPVVSAVTTDAAVENVQVGAAVLLVQPKITPNHPVLFVDLATGVPTAPIHRNEAGNTSPAPTQPSGVLGRLTASLAEIVVPHLFLTPSTAGDGLAAGMALIILLSLTFVGRPALTFGQWLRRGGYAHAARSDVVGALFTSYFATPSILSYAVAPGPSRSSFLMVSDNKTLFSMVPNAIRKED